MCEDNRECTSEEILVDVVVNPWRVVGRGVVTDMNPEIVMDGGCVVVGEGSSEHIQQQQHQDVSWVH